MGLHGEPQLLPARFVPWQGDGACGASSKGHGLFLFVSFCFSWRQVEIQLDGCYLERLGMRLVVVARTRWGHVLLVGVLLPHLYLRIPPWQSACLGERCAKGIWSFGAPAGWVALVASPSFSVGPGPGT